MNTQEKIEQLQKELDELKKEAKQKFEEGDWIKQQHGLIGRIESMPENVNTEERFEWSGLNSNRTWVNNVLKCSNFGWEKATEDEIKKALDKERKRRGLVKETHIKSLLFNGSEAVIKDGFETKYERQKDQFWFGGNVVYKEGQWAEPIEQNKIYDYSVKQLAGSRESWYKVGCEQLPYSFMEQLVTLTKKHDIKIELEGHDVTDDIINLNL